MQTTLYIDTNFDQKQKEELVTIVKYRRNTGNSYYLATVKCNRIPCHTQQFCK